MDDAYADDIHRIPPGVHRSNLEQHNEHQRRKTRKKLGPVKKHKGAYGPVGIGNANVDGGILNEKNLESGQDTDADMERYNKMGKEIKRRVLKGTR